jgi:transcriptional regulator with XRE-family HTH domain
MTLNSDPTDTALRLHIAEKLRTRRLALGLTVKQASASAGLHLRHWQKLEAAELNVTVYTLVRAAAAVTLDPALLLNLPKKRRPMEPLLP